MVIESLVNPAKAEGRPWEMFFLGFLYASIAVFLSLWIFQDYSSLVMVFLTVFASVPVVYTLIAIEEKKDTSGRSERSLLKEHSKALAVLIFLFLGYTFWSEALKGQKKEIEAFLKKRTKIIAFENAYHGDTIGSVSVGGIDLFHKKYKPLLFKAIRSPINAKKLENILEIQQGIIYSGLPKEKVFSNEKMFDECLAQAKATMTAVRGKIFT